MPGANYHHRRRIFYHNLLSTKPPQTALKGREDGKEGKFWFDSRERGKGSRKSAKVGSYIVLISQKE